MMPENDIAYECDDYRYSDDFYSGGGHGFGHGDSPICFRATFANNYGDDGYNGGYGDGVNGDGNGTSNYGDELFEDDLIAYKRPKP